MPEGLLLADSRGHSLKETHVNKLLKIEAHSGYSIDDLLSLGDQLASNRDYRCIYVMGGVNNLSSKHLSGQITPVFGEVGNMVEVMTDKFEHIRSVLSGKTEKCIICPIVGLNFDMFNKEKANIISDFSKEQLIVNDAVLHINRAIISMNSDSQVATPWTSNVVHNWSNGRLSHKYHLLYDGIHATDTVTNDWAKKILKSLESNLP